MKSQNLYPKKPRLSASQSLDGPDAVFHDSFKPSFANDGTIIYGVLGSARQISGELEPVMLPLVSEHAEVRFARWKTVARDFSSGTLAVQKEASQIELVDGFPFARFLSDTSFDAFASSDEKKQNNTLVWRLASVLFDSITTACENRVSVDGMGQELVGEYEDRLRLDALTAFWVELLMPAVKENIRMARSPEETALQCLTVNDVMGAAEALAEAKNLRLATLVAQLPLAETARETLRRQIDVWCERNDWSEMSDSIRAIYSILAGEFCHVKGSGKAAEDRAAAFTLADRYKLDWKQSFALRLFHGGFASCGEAVDAYIVDIESGKETAAPRPSWAAPAEMDRQDVLFSMLRLLASTHPDLDALFDAKNVSGTYADSRLAFQLATAFQEKGFALEEDKFDRIVVGYAAEVENAMRHPAEEDTPEDALVTAVWVLLHLRNRSSRELAVAQLLLRNGHAIPEPNEADATNVFTILHNELSIPTALLWKAKAQHEHSLPERNAALETLWLLRADCVDDAHRVLVEHVGPDAVIGEDYVDLDFVLAAFAETATVLPDDWASGGAVFEAFMKLLQLSKKDKAGRKGVEAREMLGKALQLMRDHLAVSHATALLRPRVALVEMQRILKEETARESVPGMSGRNRTSFKGPAALPDVMDMDDPTADIRTGMSAFERYGAAMGVVV